MLVKAALEAVEPVYALLCLVFATATIASLAMIATAAQDLISRMRVGQHEYLPGDSCGVGTSTSPLDVSIVMNMVDLKHGAPMLSAACALVPKFFDGTFSGSMVFSKNLPTVFFWMRNLPFHVACPPLDCVFFYIGRPSLLVATLAVLSVALWITCAPFTHHK